MDLTPACIYVSMGQIIFNSLSALSLIEPGLVNNNTDSEEAFMAH
jgi:hypothetical protein